MKSDQLLLYYKKEPAENDKVGPMEIEGTGDLEKIEAKGNVSVTQGDRIATGDEGVYFHDTGQIILTGNAVLSEGKNSIKGDRVIVYLNEKRGIVESNRRKRSQSYNLSAGKKENRSQLASI